MELVFNETQTAEIRSILHKYKFSLPTCKITDYILNLKLLGKNSASDTAIISGDVKVLDRPYGVIIKFSFASRINNSLIIEIEIYSRLLNYIKSHITPNIMAFVAFKQCKDFIPFAQAIVRHKEAHYELYEHLVDYFKRLSDAGKLNHYDLSIANLLIIERGMGEPIIKDFRKLEGWAFKQRTENEWLSMFFQVYYTLTQFSIDKIRHNDLHLGNVWMDSSIQNENFVYFIDANTYYVIPINDIVKIYDYDHSAAPGEVNTILNKLCPMYGECQSPNDKFDSYRFISSLYTVAKYYALNNRLAEANFIDGIFKYIVPSDKWRDSTKCCKLPERLCVTSGEDLNEPKIKENTDICLDNWSIPDHLIRSPIQFITSSFFNRFRHTLPEYDPNYIDYPHIYILSSAGTFDYIKTKLKIMYKGLHKLPLSQDETSIQLANKYHKMKEIIF